MTSREIRPWGCQRCHKPLTLKTTTWLELSTDTNLFHRQGEFPAGQTSQGCFPFGKRCAARVLAEGAQ